MTRSNDNKNEYDLTESKPKSTNKGMVVNPPRFHSSNETVPSAS